MKINMSQDKHEPRGGKGNMEGELLSVIVPVYNTERYLAKCIDSIRNQRYSNLEIILVDDGSPDGSGIICDEYKKVDSRIKVIHKENGGIISARKAGVSIARGGYVTYVDSDDWIEPEMYMELMEKAIQYNADIVSSGLKREYADSVIEELDHVGQGFYDRNSMERNVFPKMICTGNFYESGINVHVYNKIFKAKIVRKHQLELEDGIRIGEDAGVVYPCYLEAERIFVLHKSFYHYALRSDSCMGMKKKDEIQRLSMLNKHLRKCINDMPLSELLARQVIKYMYYLILLGVTDKAVFVDERNRVIPFNGLKKTDRVILYGAGKMGKALYPLMKEQFGMKIVVWMDAFSGHGVEGVDVLDKITPDEYDKIVIAAANYRVIEDMKRKVLGFGVPIEKVCTLKCGNFNFEELDKMLKREWA
jgi:glycosyltransferase involved in cell wall biosynthesis